MKDRAVDPVALEVLWTRLISAVDEAARVIVRTAFSTLSNEANDFACVLTDAEGHALAQNSGSIPSFIGTLPATVRHFLNAFGQSGMSPGDVLITNNPWQGTGHLNDVCVVKPIYADGTLVAFAASTAHVPDIGGFIRSIVPREVFEEGFHIPLTKLIRAGTVDETLLTLLAANVRTPDQTIGDVWAQVSALNLIEKRVLQVMGEHGLASLEELASELFARAEGAMREAIAALPDGTYPYELTTDGLDEPFVFKVAVTVAGDAITVDFAGTSPAQPRAINCVYAYTFAMTAYALKCLLVPDVPNNEGMYRPLTVTAPEGSILNPRFPAAVGGRSSTGHYVPVAVIGALAPVLPDRAIAGVGSPLWCLTQTGTRDDGRPYANVMFFNGGMGALAGKDGEAALSWPSNISSTPVEVAEANSPFVFHHKRLVPNSGGAGRHRGGLGQEIVLESRSERPISVIFLAERTREPAPGLAGGGPGRPGAVEIDGRPVDNRAQHIIARGGRILLRTPGGGGHGPPAERDADDVARDARLGITS
ncbi:hydantoinase B/oxoprolinase family protein [Acuticoccus sp.]|uniref:hydantoinase B/oxoprolinase family protein n=1 Tax=Acuticoccus sp. TaxID=1904378 RepID=UPI003B522DA3